MTTSDDTKGLVKAADMVDSNLWCVTIQGPDDLIAAESRKLAVQMALTFNQEIARQFEQDPHPYAPLIWACPGVWPYDAASHASSLSRPDDYTGLAETAKAALISTGAK